MRNLPEMVMFNKKKERKKRLKSSKEQKRKGAVPPHLLYAVVTSPRPGARQPISVRHSHSAVFCAHHATVHTLNITLGCNLPHDIIDAILTKKSHCLSVTSQSPKMHRSWFAGISLHGVAAAK